MPRPSSCRAVEPDLIAAALGEASAPAARRVGEHVERCGPCREDLDRYRTIDRLADGLRRAPVPADAMAAFSRALDARLAELRRRLVAYRIFPSPLGRILIARSEQGVVLVEYLRRGSAPGRLQRLSGIEPVRDGADLEALYRELVAYLAGRRTALAWPLDLRLASGFQRAVLEATASLPYGAVTSYARIAAEVGKPGAVRAVAQALRWNPVPIAVPCHRIVGSAGALVGYAGDRLTLKQRLLVLEGVPIRRQDGEPRVVPDAMYVRTADDPEYCIPTCPSVIPLTLARLTLYASRARAEAAGLRPCTTCRPDLHPLPR